MRGRTGARVGAADGVAAPHPAQLRAVRDGEGLVVGELQIAATCAIKLTLDWLKELGV